MTSSIPEQVSEELSKPFPVEDLEWRVGHSRGGKGSVLIYVDARAVADRLDAVLGLGNWFAEHRRMARPDGTAAWICRLSLRLARPDGTYEWVAQEDGADETKIEPTKGGISDSFKRAAVRWQIGRYLYNVPIQYVALENGKYIPRGWKPELPPWALPKGVERNQAIASKPAPTAASRTPRPAAKGASSKLPPGDPPFDVTQPIRFGKYKGEPWMHLLMGSPDGKRRQYLQWYIENGDTAQTSHKYACMLMAWAADGERAKLSAEHDAPPKEDNDVELGGDDGWFPSAPEDTDDVPF